MPTLFSVFENPNRSDQGLCHGGPLKMPIISVMPVFRPLLHFYRNLFLLLSEGGEPDQFEVKKGAFTALSDAPLLLDLI